MKFKIKIRGIIYNDEIIEHNQEFSCEECKKVIYGKLAKYEFYKGGRKRELCLKCAIKDYESMVIGNPKIETDIEKAIKEIKEKFWKDLVIDEL